MITVAEVKTFTEKRAADGDEPVGVCGNATACLVASAILDKYPDIQQVWVGWGGEMDTHLVVRKSLAGEPYYDGEVVWDAGREDPETAKVIDLIRAFDRLGVPGGVPASAVLPLFEDEKPAQVDTGINEFEAYPDEEEDEDDDLPFDEDDEDEWDDDGGLWDGEWDWEDDDEDEE